MDRNSLFGTMHMSRTIIGTLFLLLLATAQVHAQPHGDALPAIWRTHHIDFDFRSDRLAFRCEEFAWRLGRMLASIGARLDSRTQLQCAESFSNVVKGSVVVAAPIEATDANVRRALAEISTVDRLAARVNGLPDPSTLIRSFPAEWRRVSKMQPKLDAADCELLRAVERQLLPVLELRDLRVSASCTSNSVPRFSATALIRVNVSVDGGEAHTPAVAAEVRCDRERHGDACDATREETELPAG